MKKQRQPILIVCGTRPEIIKLAPLYFNARHVLGNDRIQWVSTGQHQGLEKGTLQDFGIKPSHYLEASNADACLTRTHARIVERLSEIIDRIHPALVIVQGDTVSAFSAAFASYHKCVPVAHVEAGLRTYDNDNPYPEEAYRRMIGSLATLHFAPTPLAAQHLRNEGCEDNNICVTGNTVIDALSMVDQLADRLPPAELPAIAEGQRMMFVTMHRRESWSGGLSNMCHALREIVDRYSDIHVVFPLHINPKVQEQIKPILQEHPRVTLLPPLNFAACHALISKSYLVLTDSGGIQEEAPSYAVPVIVLRQITERPEAVSEGIAILTGTEKDDIVETACKLLDDAQLRNKMRKNGNPFGDGKASHRIVKAISRFLEGREPLLLEEEEFHHRIEVIS